MLRSSPNQWFELPLSLSEGLREKILDIDIENARNYFIHEPEDNHRLEFLEIDLDILRELTEQFKVKPTKSTLVAISPTDIVPWHIDGQSHDYHRPAVGCFPIFPNSKTYECTEYRDGFVPYCNYVFNTREEHRAKAGDCRRLNLQLWFAQEFEELKKLLDDGKLLI
tara:strand:- start:283 stop:783 length:501 start_codon:yes stop_codon:yes gene_type:complete